MPSRKTDTKNQDQDMEEFIRNNRDMIEKLLKEEREKIKKAVEDESFGARKFTESQEEMALEAFYKNKQEFEQFADVQKKKAEQTAQSFVMMIMDPEFQKHMVSAGMELMMAFEALIRSAPLPDFAKEAAEKAQETRDNVSKTYCEKNPDCVKRTSTKKTQTQRIPIKGSEKVDKNDPDG